MKKKGGRRQKGILLEFCLSHPCLFQTNCCWNYLTIPTVNSSPIAIACLYNACVKCSHIGSIVACQSSNCFCFCKGQMFIQHVQHILLRPVWISRTQEMWRSHLPWMYHLSSVSSKAVLFPALAALSRSTAISMWSFNCEVS